MDRLFGFYEPRRPGHDPQFWLDHKRSSPLRHVFMLVNTDSLKNRPHDTFEGVARVRERIRLGFSGGYDELLYEAYHDIWCVGPGQLVCGGHGEDCPANDLVARWCETRGRIKHLAHYPRVTWDGRIFLVGVRMSASDQNYRLKFE